MIPPLKSFDRTIFQIVLKSLKEHPEQWRVDAHEVSNNTIGVVIWVANGISGLHVKMSKEDYRFGDVTMSSVFLGWLTWRASLMRAVSGMRKQSVRDKQDAILARLRIQGRD